MTGRLFNYARTDPDGSLVFTTTGTVGQLGDIIRKLTNGTLEYRGAKGVQMRFDSSGRVTTLVDRNGNTTALSYTGPNLTRITDPVGRFITLTYDSSNRIVTASDPIGRGSYSYEGTPGVAGAPGLTTVTDPLQKVERYEYVTGGRLSKVTDKRNVVAKQITYDGAARVVEQRFADGGVEQYGYVVSGTVVVATLRTDAEGRSTSMRFNPTGYVIATTDGLGQTSMIDRSLATTLPGSTKGPCGCTEVIRQFDERGNVTAMTDRLGQIETSEYEPVFNNVTRNTDKLGHATLYSYDSRGNLTAVTRATAQGNFTTSFGYSAFGELTSMTDPLTHATTFEYDSQGNMTAVVDQLGNRTTSEYDGIGRQTANSDPLLRRTTMAYNALYVTVVTDPAQVTTHFDCDENGNQTGQTDALQHRWRSVFDGKNRLQSVIDPTGRLTTFSYTKADELSAAVSPSGRTTRYVYDARGQVSSITDPINGVVRLSYNNRGNLTGLRDQRGNTTTYAYVWMMTAGGPRGRASWVICME